MTAIPYLTAAMLIVLAVALMLAGWRMVRGPSAVDRFIALDMLTAVAVASPRSLRSRRAGARSSISRSASR